MHATAPRLASPDDEARLRAAAYDDSGVLNDVIRADLLAPHADSATWFVPDGLAHVQRDDRNARWWLLGINAPSAAWPALLEPVHRHVADHGGGEVTWWRAGATNDEIRTASELGFSVARQQRELRVHLPLEAAPGAGTIGLRTLQAEDVDAVLAVNNAAFAGHPEQGGWTRATIAERMDLPWFDRTLFVVAEAPDHRIVGFNWLKPHDASARDVARGEIYAIAVDPSEHGRGLGRTLAVFGLDLLHRRGFEWASLFVAADNAPALALYSSLGFTMHRTDTALVTTIER